MALIGLVFAKHFHILNSFLPIGMFYLLGSQLNIGCCVLEVFFYYLQSICSVAVHFAFYLMFF